MRREFITLLGEGAAFALPLPRAGRAAGKEAAHRILGWMTQAVELLVLVQRLRREADSELAIDLRLACRHLRQYAAQWIAVEAERRPHSGLQCGPAELHDRARI